MPRSKNPQIYVAGFSRRTNEDDLEDSFRKYGKIRDVVIKKGYAFIVSSYSFSFDFNELLGI